MSKLDAAIDILNRDGWMKGATNTGQKKPHCAIGALRTAYMEDKEWLDYSEVVVLPEYLSDRLALIRAIQRINGEEEVFIIDWNDRPGTTKKHVIAAFEKAKEFVQ